MITGQFLSLKNTEDKTINKSLHHKNSIALSLGHALNLSLNIILNVNKPHGGMF